MSYFLPNVGISLRHNEGVNRLSAFIYRVGLNMLLWSVSV